MSKHPDRRCFRCSGTGYRKGTRCDVCQGSGFFRRPSQKAIKAALDFMAMGKKGRPPEGSNNGNDESQS